MKDRLIDAIHGHVFDDPGFYGAKESLRSAFPEADMIEIADGVITVVRSGVASHFYL